MVQLIFADELLIASLQIRINRVLNNVKYEYHISTFCILQTLITTLQNTSSMPPHIS